MKKINIIIICVLITILTILSCSKTEYKPVELYNDYLKIEISSINETTQDSLYEIRILNSKDVVFENECLLIFELFESDSEKLVLHSEERIINKKFPGNPSLGFLNIQNGGNYTQIANLRELNWSGYNIDMLEKGNYTLSVTLFIDDPSSPSNRLTSDKLVYQKQ